MFPGYDSNKKPPYSQVVYFERDGIKYKTVYYVSNGYGGSISISSSSIDIVTSEKQDEENSNRQQV